MKTNVIKQKGATLEQNPLVKSTKIGCCENASKRIGFTGNMTVAHTIHGIHIAWLFEHIEVRTYRRALMQ